MPTSKYDSVDQLPDLTENVISVDSGTKKVTTYKSVDELPIIKKKVGGGVNGTELEKPSQEEISNLWNAGVSPNIQNFKYEKPAIPNSNLGYDVGMQPPDIQAMKEQEKKGLQKAAENTVLYNIEKNPTLKSLLLTDKKHLPSISSSQEKFNDFFNKQRNNISLRNEQRTADKLSINNLKNIPYVQQQIAKTMQAYENGDLARTTFQNGDKAGEPVFTRPAKGLESFGNSIINSVKETKYAIVAMGKSDSELADYFDKQRRDLPDIPESTPTGAGAMVGNVLGGFIKPVTEFAGGEAVEPLGGGLIALAPDLIQSTTTAKTKELYFDNMNKLRQQYGDNIPEEKRLTAIRMARSDAPIQALPDEALQLYLFSKGAGGIENNLATQSFKNALKKTGVDVTKMGLLGAGSQKLTEGISALQGNEPEEKGTEEAIANWMMMEGAFKALHLTTQVPKYFKSAAKEMYVTAPPEVQQKLSDQAIQQGWSTVEKEQQLQNDLQQYKDARDKVKDYVPPEDIPSFAGLQQKRDNLENDLLKEQESKASPVLKENNIQIIKAQIAEVDEQMQKMQQSNKSAIDHEKDDLTLYSEPKITGKQTEENGVTVIEPTVRPSEGVDVIMPEQINRPEITTIGNETEAPKIIEQKGNAGSDQSDERLPATESIPSETIPSETSQTQINSNQDAISEQSPNAMDVLPKATDGEGMGSGNIQPESTTGTQSKETIGSNEKEKVDIHTEYPPTSLNYSGTGKLENEFGVDQRQPTEVKHDIETIKEADNLIEKGWKPQDAINRIESGEAQFVSDAEYVNLTRYGAELGHRLRNIKDIDSPEYDVTLRELNRVANVANAAGKETGRALGIRGRFKTVQDGTYEDFMLTEMDANNDATLTKNQKQEANKDWTKFQQAKEQFEKDQQSFADAVAKFNAEKELGKAKKNAPKNTKKTHDDFVKERTSLIEKLKKQKEEHEAKMREQGIHTSGFGITLTTDMVKTIKDIVASHVSETAQKLSDVIDKVFEQVKEVFPDLEKRDIHNIIAGEYNEKKITKTQAAIAMENLRIEAAAINRLEKLEKGEEPKNEKAKRKRNNEIEQLQKQIREHGVTKLAELKKRNETATAKIKEVIAKGDFSPEEKKTPILQNKEFQKQFPELFKQVQKSNDELIKTRNDIALRRAKWMYEHRTDTQKTMDVIAKSLNIPRTLMTIGDFSAVFRQAAVATAAHPVIATKAAKFMFEAAASEKIYNRWLDEVHNDPLWEAAQKSKLPITDPASLHAREHEEAFYGAQYAEKIPIAGEVVKASERAYNGYLNFIRWEMFKMYANKFMAEGKTVENNPKLYEGISSFIGSATGRGGMKGIESASPILNAVLFASRLIASRVNMLGLSDIPNLVVRAATLGKRGVDFGFYSKLPKEIRIEAAKDMVKFVGVGIATLVLAKQMGAQVELDPRSSDFGKIHDGNTRWDIWGGFQPYARLISQIISGQAKSTTTGEVYNLDASKYGGKSVGDQIGTFTRGKLSPIFGIGADILTRRTLDQQTLDRRFDIPFYSKDNSPQGHITLTDEMLKSITPLLANDIREAMQDRGISALYTVGIPSLFGIGVQTYQPKVSNGTTGTLKVPKVSVPKVQVPR